MNSISMKKVKIVATLGPSSDSLEMITKLVHAGVDVFRLNFSHYTPEKGVEVLRKIRTVEKKLKRPIAAFADLVGPKIRINEVEQESELGIGDVVLIKKGSDTGSAKFLTLNFPDIVDRLEVGADIYLGDGGIRLIVEKKTKEGVVARVIVGGMLRSRMGFAAHGMSLAKFILTPKDRAVITAMVEEGVDGLAISFIQTEKDLLSVKKLLPKDNQPILIAKIETASAVERAEEILKVADVLMIARGDLGSAMPLGELPHIQKDLIKLCRKYAKPVITATQMLESMTQAHMPTRAEVTDVANAILDGTDAIMLSGETAIGRFPLVVVETMKKIALRAALEIPKTDPFGENLVGGSVTESAVNIAGNVGAKMILAFTETGATARRLSRFRPAQIILGLSPHIKTLRQLCFSWGVYAHQVKPTKSFEVTVKIAHQIALKNRVLNLKKGELFVMSAGIDPGKSGGTNLVVVEEA